jgi:hypothetical protein
MDQATTIANQLGQHAADMNEMRLQNFQTKTLLYRQETKQDEGKRTSDDESDATKDLAKVPIMAKTIKNVGMATALVPATLMRGGTLREGITGAKNFLDETGDTEKLFGEGAMAVEKMGGVEGIVAQALVKGGGETFAKFGAKAVGDVGAGINIIGDFDNLLQTGNPFNSKNADGSIKKATLGQDVGNVGTILAGGLDILAAFTGGALAPIAAAANIAVAAESTAADMIANAKQATLDSKDAPGPNAPLNIAPAAFSALGMLANQSHNPLDRIG